MIALIASICSIAFGALGFIISYLTFSRKKSREDMEDGARSGATMSELGYIKAGVDDIKREMREIRAEQQKQAERLTRVEESAKQAHKRIDEITGRIVM